MLWEFVVVGNRRFHFITTTILLISAFISVNGGGTNYLGGVELFAGRAEERGREASTVKGKASWPLDLRERIFLCTDVLLLDGTATPFLNHCRRNICREWPGERKRDLNCIDVMNIVITVNICIRNISVND
jgi:hypothetical protein